MAAKARRKSRKDRILPPSPQEIRQHREATELERLTREEAEKRAQRQPDGYGINEDALSLAQHAGVEIRRDVRGKAKAVWRSNPFKLLLESGSLTQDEANAAHDFMAIYAKSKGLAGAPQSVVIVDGGDPDAWGAEDRKQYAIRLCGMITEALTTKSAKLVKAFAFAIVEEDRPMSWRGIVEREIGERDKDRQVARMEVMCEELCDVIPDCRKRLNDWIGRKAA